jgi:hypothetical protein
MCSVNNPYFSKPHFIWAYLPQSSKSGESVIQPVNDLSRVLNPEPPVYVKMIRKSPENSLDSAEMEYNPGCKLMKKQLSHPDPGSIPKNSDELSSSMTNSLDFESDPAYHPCSSPSPSSFLLGSNCSSCDLVDMAPKRSCCRVTKGASNTVTKMVPSRLALLGLVSTGKKRGQNGPTFEVSINYYGFRRHG